MLANDEQIKFTIKNRIRRYREENNLTQAQLCELLGISRTTYTKWESGDTLPNAVQLTKLARIYNIDISTIVDVDVSFKVANEDTLTDRYLSDLSKEEIDLITHYRLLDEKEQNKVIKYISKIKKD